MSLRDQLTAIYQEHDRLTPDLVVEAATPPDHPLHDRFEWNDKLAGHEYRKVQAAELIRKVKVVYADEGGPNEKSVRAFLATSRDDTAERTYRPIEAVMADPFSQKLVLQECLREWKTFERKYGHLTEFARIIGRPAA
jgi:hypothetical protein